MERQEFGCESSGRSFGTAAELDERNVRIHNGHPQTSAQDALGGGRPPTMNASGDDTEENQDEDTEE